MVIRAIVYAKDEEEALDKAREIFDKLVEDKYFDYYTTFDEDSPMSSKNRWGSLPVVAEANSPEGKKLIDDGMNFAWSEFKECMKKIRSVLDRFDDEEIFEEEVLDKTKKVELKLDGNKDLELDLSMIRYYFYCCSEYDYHSIWLYDNSGLPITKRSRLKKVLEKPNQHGNKIFVVPADVHF
jgi:hypothetical protein